MDQQYPGWSQSPSQQELARTQAAPQQARSSQHSDSPTFTTLMPPADSQQPRRSQSAPLEESFFNLSDYLSSLDIGATPQQQSSRGTTPVPATKSDKDTDQQDTENE